MTSEDRFVVRRSHFMLAFQFGVALLLIGMAVHALAWKDPPLAPDRLIYAWLGIAGGGIALFVAVRRAFLPSEMLAIDRNGLTWWKADRTIRWAEIERVSIDSYRSTLYLHVKLAAAAGDVDRDAAHPIELFGSLLTGSDISFRLSDGNMGRDRLRDALERVMPETVILKPDA